MIDELLQLYETLDPDARAKFRQEILRRAGADEAERKKQREEHQEIEPFTPPSDDLIRYLNTVKEAFRPYFPKDSYRPGDEDRIDLIREDVMLALEPLEWLLKAYFRYEVKGLANIPK